MTELMLVVVPLVALFTVLLVAYGDQLAVALATLRRG